MRARWSFLVFLIPPLTAALVGAVPPTTPHDGLDNVAHDALVRRDGHSHGHHAQPVLELNETELTLHHAPTPASYWTIDLVDRTSDEKRYPGLMGLHILCMSLAFFGALPAGIALRSVKHAWHGLSVILFYVFCVLGLSASALYKKLTPNMYEGNVHGLQGYLVLAFAAVLSTLDIVAGVGRLVRYAKSIRAGEDKFAFKPFWRYVILGREENLSGASAEYTNLVVDEPEELDDQEFEMKDRSEPIHVRRARAMTPIATDLDSSHDEHGQWENDGESHHHYPQSAGSERTLFGPRSPKGSISSLDAFQEAVGQSFAGYTRSSALRAVGRGMFATAERVLVFAGLMQFITGIVIYTGGCRENYINGCLAHLIKGAIFWCYGLTTFGRFLGAFSELGWAWNRTPHRQYPSAEFVESLVIFIYGVTNTWMERFGAQPGDPFTTKQVQHISIAVMFWFAGLVGIGIESKTVRRWLASGAVAAVPASSRSQEAVAEPPSYIASFNPFPALCIGVTGAAMSAHFQTYIFQVQIHALWGLFLSGFAVFRCLTYFFLWLAPPRSILPSRPPTEALAAFFLTCGGLVFMFSTEELTIAAMRQGHDDVMMVLNVAIAITCLAFCWCLGVVALKGWLKSHTQKSVKFHSSA